MISKPYYALKARPTVPANRVIVPWLLPGCSKSLQGVMKGTSNLDQETQSRTTHNFPSFPKEFHHTSAFAFEQLFINSPFIVLLHFYYLNEGGKHLNGLHLY